MLELVNPIILGNRLILLCIYLLSSFLLIIACILSNLDWSRDFANNKLLSGSSTNDVTSKFEIFFNTSPIVVDESFPSG